MRRIGLVAAFIGAIMTFTWAQEPQPQAVEQKDLEIYNLRSELEYYKKQLQKLMKDNALLRDSMRQKLPTQQTPAAPAEDPNLRILYKTFEEDHALAEQIIADIKTNISQPALPAAAVAFDDSSFTKRYNWALNQYFEGNYQKAAEQFKQLLQLRRDHPLSDNCQYWLGECYYSRQKYAEALPIFEKVKDLGDHNKADAAQFKIGLTYLKLGKRSEAMKAFQELERNYPDSELVPRARQYYQQPEKF